jgi:flavorubredoxin
MKEFLNAVKVTDNVYWVGAIDWAIKDFHGYGTDRGTTYNAYLIMADKITLVDTVKAPFFDEMMARIRSVVEPEKIDYIISNHAEMDHSGALPGTIEAVKPEKVFASVMGEKNLNAQLDINFEITPVKTGEDLSLGNMNVSFLETKMLHWPDSMFTYLKEDKLLFSQDGFGMHLATDDIFEDENEPGVIYWEASKYYANILLPYSQQVLKLIEALPGLNLDIEIIAPDHGPVWRKDIGRIINWYKNWALQEYSNKAIIIYDTMWHSTAHMANAIADGLKSSGADVRVIPLSSEDRSFAATEILDASALIVGSPTLNNNIFPTVADVMTYLKGLRPKNLIGAAFGSYGWGGESIKHLSGILEDMGVELVAEGLKVKYVPKHEDLKECHKLGEDIGKILMERSKEQ